jgi:hypothetical protein
VDCEGVQHYAGSAIDGILEKEVEHEFHVHLERCRPCRQEVGLEKLSKQLIQRYVSWVPTPRSIEILVLTSLRREYSAADGVNHTWWTGVARLRFLVPAITGGAVAAAFFLMANTPSDRSYRLSAHTAQNDLIHQSFETLSLLKTGQIIPTIVSSVPESVKGFFQKSALNFRVQIPSVSGSEWYGGSASDNNGVKQAHVLYRIGSEWLYVCETGAGDAISGTKLSLPPAAKVALTNSGWYTDPMHPMCNIVVWKKNTVVCVAVSTIGKKQLLALLAPPTDIP